MASKIPAPPLPRTYPTATLTPRQMVDELRAFGVKLDNPAEVSDELLRKLWRLICREGPDLSVEAIGNPRMYSERVARHGLPSLPGRRKELLKMTQLGKCVIEGRRYYKPGE